MFSAAYQIVRQFTRPVIASRKTLSGQVSSGLGTFIVVNREGWIVTAAHIFNNLIAFSQHKSEHEDYLRKKALLDQHRATPKSQRGKGQIVVPNPNPDWIMAQSLWWCQNGAIAQPIHLDPLADVAIAKLENFDTSRINNFPKFKTGDPLPGQSLCRLGFPFHAIEAIFNETSGVFEMQNFTLPPMFPNDGIHTRIHTVPGENGRFARLIETSTPGLRGQSGGPLFDSSGNVWGVQSKTLHLDLGFKPIVNDEGGKIITGGRQFMHVGLAAHAQHVIDLLDQHNVPFEIA